MKSFIRIIVFILLIIFSLLYLYIFTPLILDGVWTYGFGYNISIGLIPYKDFSMIIPPLFPYLIAPFIKIVGNRLITYYIIISVIITIITFISYKRLGWKSIIIYFMLLIYPHNGYNIFALFLLFILIIILDKEKNNDIVIPIIISLMFLTKQTLGILIIPSIIYSKNKKKTILIYIISCLLLLIYLIINNNLYNFIDYCFLGMLDFTSNNKTKFNIFMCAEIILCIYMIVILVKSNLKDKTIFYILLFQIISFPITDGSHFVITLIPLVYYIYNKYTNKNITYIFTVMLVFYVVVFNINLYSTDQGDIYLNKNSFLYGKTLNFYTIDYFENIKEYTKIYNKHRLFLLDTRAYMGKLEYNMRIDKYDLINNGNMGYKGSSKYLKEIKDYCESNKCLFIINVKEVLENINQTDKNIVKYIMNNYYNVTSTGIENIYINKM